MCDTAKEDTVHSTQAIRYHTHKVCQAYRQGTKEESKIQRVTLDERRARSQFAGVPKQTSSDRWVETLQIEDSPRQNAGNEDIGKNLRSLRDGPDW
jgi:hypothetical protein